MEMEGAATMYVISLETNLLFFWFRITFANQGQVPDRVPPLRRVRHPDIHVGRPAGLEVAKNSRVYVRVEL